MRRFVTFLLFLSIIFGLTMTLSPKEEGVVLSNNNICMVLQVEGNGTVTQELSFPCQSEVLESLNLTKESAEKIRSSLRDNIAVIRDEYLINLMIIYNLNPKSEFSLGQGVIISTAEYSESADVIGFDIIYSSIDAFKYYNGGQSDGAKNSKIKLYQKSTSKSTFPFASLVKVSKDESIPLGARYKNIYFRAFSDYLTPEQFLVVKMPTFIYDYSFPSAKLKTNCDISKKISAQTHYIWVRSEEEYLTNSEMKISLSVVNTKLLYGIILGGTITLMLCAALGYLIFLGIKGAKRKNN